MTQFQSGTKKDLPGTRTLFECNQFRIPQVSEPVENDPDEPSESSVTRKRTIPQDQTTTVPKKLTRHDCYTPGQIDPHVMNELPIPIRQEVEDYLNNPSIILEPITDPERIEIAEKSFTQVMDHIDEAVLNELPLEMRREIMIAQKLRKIESKYPPVGGKRLIPVSVPTNKEKSNAFNVLMNSPQKQPGLKKQSIPIKKWRTETILQDEPNVPLIRFEPKPQANEQNKHKQPSIAGCTSLSDVKLMLREWIESSDEPNQIDLDLFQNYLIDLLNNYNAEMVHQLLAYGLLQLKTSNKINWNEKFQVLITAVQIRFCQMYGGAKMDLS
jgi:hypothetical protein